MLSDEAPETMDKPEAARLLGCSVRHLERLLVDGEIEGVPNGPRGGLRPTRRGVERRRAETATPALDHEPIVPPSSPDLLTPTIEQPPASDAASKRRAPSWHRAGWRIVAPLRALAGRCWRRVQRRRMRVVRTLIGASIVAALLLVGASRDNAASKARDARAVVVVMRAGPDRHAIRARCRVHAGRTVYVRIRSGRRARCSSRRR
jgi:hypothetical protein